MPEILRAWSSTIAIVDVVAQEVQYVLRGGNGDDAREREPILLTPLIASGTISVISDYNDEELETLVDFAQQLDDGEAMTAALAIHRNCVVVTDDRKAVRLLNERGVAICSTLELIKLWADRERLDLDVQREVLSDLRYRGTYEPPRSHPFRGWWEFVTGDP